jgi:hypothetical protein
MTQEKLIDHGIEITLPTPDDFLKIKETLTRIGIKSKKSNILYQSCNILHKRGSYYILHFKELFQLSNRDADFTDDDFRRRNTIAKLLMEWGMCKVVNLEQINVTVPITELAIIPYKEKKNFELVSKFQVGKKGK